MLGISLFLCIQTFMGRAIALSTVFPVLRWRQIDSLLHIPAEIRHGREIHPFGDFRQREFFLSEQTGDFLHGEA